MEMIDFPGGVLTIKVALRHLQPVSDDILEALYRDTINIVLPRVVSSCEEHGITEPNSNPSTAHQETLYGEDYLIVVNAGLLLYHADSRYLAQEILAKAMTDLYQLTELFHRLIREENDRTPPDEMNLSYKLVDRLLNLTSAEILSATFKQLREEDDNPPSPTPLTSLADFTHTVPPTSDGSPPRIYGVRGFNDAS